MSLKMLTGSLALATSLFVACPPLQAKDADEPVCNRACLEGFANSYLAALGRKTPAGVKFTTDVKYTENQRRVDIGQGLWTRSAEIGPYKFYVADVRRSQIAYLGNVKTDGGWSMLAIRLRIREGAISEVETIFPGPASGEGTFDLGGGASRLKQARASFSTALTPTERRDRSQIIQAADLHYEGIHRGNGDIAPFSESCIKIENGVQLIRNPDFPSPVRSPTGAKLPNYQALGCQDQFNTHIWDTDEVTDRRYPVVDEERGVVVAFIMYHQYVRGPCAYVVNHGPACPSQAVEPYTLAAAEAFKVRDGFIDDVEAIFTVLPELRLRGVW